MARLARVVIDPESGVPVASGEGAPTGLDLPRGTIYLRRDGASGTTIYEKHGAGVNDWSPLASGAGALAELVVGAEWGDELGPVLTADAQTPQYRPVPWPHEILGAYAWASPAGSASFEVRRKAAGVPGSGDKISGTDPIALSSAAYLEKTSFTGWSLTGAADVLYGFVPSGEATAKLIGVSLVLRRTG